MFKKNELVIYETKKLNGKSINCLKNMEGETEQILLSAPRSAALTQIRANFGNSAN